MSPPAYGVILQDTSDQALSAAFEAAQIYYSRYPVQPGAMVTPGIVVGLKPSPF